MFDKSQMELINKFYESYDNHERPAPAQDENKSPEDLSSLLDKLSDHGNDSSDSKAGHLIAPLPPLYLASILYYSPSHWSVWINDKKLVNTHNNPSNEFYVSRLSRKEVELVWKPSSLQNMPLLWAQYTAGDKQALPGIVLDASKGTVTLLLHPNQTFIPTSLSIHEGLIKPNMNLVVPMEVKDAGPHK